MKKSIIYSAIMMALAVGATSCSDFLEIDPVGAVSEATLTTQEGVDYVITGMYSALTTPQGQYTDWYPGQSWSNWTYGDMMGGDCNKGSAASDQADAGLLESYSFTTDNSYILRKWQAVYDMVSRANGVMHIAGQIEDELSAVEGEEKDYYTEAIAQARFMRGFALFDGIKNFGAAIPFITLEDYEAATDPAVSNVDESGNYIYIWDQVAEDFEYAYNNLPATWSTTGDYGRVNKWAALAYLAKLRVFQSSPYNGTNATSNHWSEAKGYFETLLANGVDSKGNKYCLADTYETLYTAGESDWTGESVFDIQLAISGTQTYTNSVNGVYYPTPPSALGNSGWGFYQPSHDLANAHLVDSDGLPYLDKSYQNYDQVTAYDQAAATVETNLSAYTDPRIDMSIGRFNVPYLDYSIPTAIDGWIRDISNGGRYIQTKKLIPKKADLGSLAVSTVAASTAKNFHLFRVADLYLLYAETCIETGDLETARQYINMIRERASKSCVMFVDGDTMEEIDSDYILEDKVNGNNIANSAANYRVGLYPSSGWTEEKATKALRFERRIELALEGHRWYDLCRWNATADELGNSGTGYLAYESNFLNKYQSCTYPARLVCLPIPFDEITTMQGVLVQNENWK